MLQGRRMIPKLEPLNLLDLTRSIDVTFLHGNSLINPTHDILIIKYFGRYPDGSAGNTDARNMVAMGKAALYAYEPSGVIIDLSELYYEWGDMLERVFGIGSDRHVDAELPLATVVGSHCREAIRTLIHGINNDKPIEEIAWVFDSLEAAWNHVEVAIDKLA
jgi:hypothetical protein